MKPASNEKVAAMSQLAGGVGHELGNILLRIMGKIELAQMEEDTAKSKNYLESAMAACERMTLLIRNLQSFGRVAVHPQKQDLMPVIHKALRLLEGDASKYKGKMILQGPKAAVCHFDEQPFLQVINNLTLNGLQSMPKGGELKITVTDQDPKWIWVTIQDQGVGMDDALKAQSFEWGFTTRGARGAGLGLPIARDILNEHQAQFELVSQAGQGTTVKIGVPR
ncbi:MAG: HAMP domain-containing histidine kinase [Bdellovibrionales bacterium]|nr:HAMP domain-containing histidine kinase [Bdellovibrionales bacterium]